MRSEIVFVSPPIAQFGSQISPDNSIFEEWQFEHRYSVIKVFDGLVGYQHSHDEQQEETETCASCKNPILREDRVGCNGQRCYQAEMWHEMVKEHEARMEPALSKLLREACR